MCHRYTHHSSEDLDGKCSQRGEETATFTQVKCSGCVPSMSLTPYTRLATLATHSWPWHSQTLEVFEDHLIALSYFQDRGVLQRVFDVSSRNVL